MTYRFFGDSSKIIYDVSNNLTIEKSNSKNIILKLGSVDNNTSIKVIDSSNNILFQTYGSNFITTNTLTVSSTIINPTVPVAYGTVEFSNGNVGISNSYPSTGISATDLGSTSRQITIPTMNSSNYFVMGFYNGGDDIGTYVSVHTRTPSGFIIGGPSESAGRYLSFIVFGTKA